MSNTITTKTLLKYKENKEKFSVLTAYDYSTAKYIDQAGIDVVLIGDSLGMTALGYKTTQKVGTEEMKIFTGAVARGVEHALVVTDMPFMSYTIDIPSALQNIGTMAKEGAHAVKLEGCNDYIEKLTECSINMGVPVMGHIGFTPQSQNVIGGYYIQGKTEEAAKELLKQAKKLESAGAFSVVLEMVPEDVAKHITENLSIPTISCGAGRYCDGFVMVCDDLFGKFDDFTPKFARKYGNMKELITNCAQKYIEDIKSNNYPNEKEIY